MREFGGIAATFRLEDGPSTSRRPCELIHIVIEFYAFIAALATSVIIGCVIRKAMQRVESVHRALQLATLLRERGELGVTEAAGELGVNASTAHRLLGTLALNGFAAQRADRRYVPGPQLAPAASGYGSVPFGVRLRPYLEGLYERIGETVHVASLVGTRIQHLDGIEATHHPLRFGLRVGVWLPAHITAGGKVLLADLTDAEVAARYAMAVAGGRVEAVAADMESLYEQLDDIRDTGVAWNFGESEPGLAALAASTGFIGGQSAAISVAVPLARYSKSRGDAWVAALMGVIDRIRADLADSHSGLQVER